MRPQLSLSRSRLAPAFHALTMSLARRPKNAFTLLKVLADSFGKGYLETALDTCVLSLLSLPTRSAASC